MSLFTQKQLLLSIRKLPRGHRCSKQVYDNRLAGGQGGLDDVLAERYSRLGKRCANPDSGGLVGSVHGVGFMYMCCSVQR